MTTVIGYVESDSPAAKAGLRPGDKILEVDGQPVSRFSGMNDSVVWNVVRSEGATIPFKVERNGQMIDFVGGPLQSRNQGWRRKSVRQVLISPGSHADRRQSRPKTPAAAGWFAKRGHHPRL